ncbi:histidine kinase [Paenibacillus sp. 19GGS1-52]|uniref:cache domain-containing sensor histidine kinase n=1 Tax=Paenibacillus sp. 19GGS1-52 TaxID=2758563 RepID=UPI001EFC1F80|nr:histidine kinase [Paenibacillus sp. 19GGS1-52]ULO06769.1 histidine kinase [Paenibacillus sp. 19GGS1-52]
MKWNSIRTKLIVFMLIAATIPIVATMLITYSYTTKSLITRSVDENANLLYQGQRNLSALLEDLNRTSTTVYSNTEFFRLLESGYDDVQSGSRMFAALSYIGTSVPNIYQVYLYESKSRKSTLVTLNIPKRSLDLPVFSEAAITGRQSIVVQKTHMSNTYGLGLLSPNYPPEPVFTLHRRIEKVPTSKVLGYLSIDVQLSALSDITDQLYQKERENVYIIDAEGNIIYSDDTAQLGQPMKQEWYTQHIAGTKSSTGNFESDNAVFVYQRLQKAGADWTLVKQIPVPYLIREANKAVAINLLLLGISLVIIVAATVIISIKITAPIKQLGRYINQVQTGKMDIDIEQVSNDEIGQVMVKFGGMMDTINNLILREYKLELSNKTNQLRALQAQINPHFLNNTLQIIGTLALELNVPRIYALLSALAKMMHYSMHNDDKTVTLKDELEHVKAYVELQKERFENRFTFRYDVEDAILGTPMPKMILQPLVENYFKHGLDRTRSDGLLLLTAKALPDGFVQIDLENNGTSISEARLESLKWKLQNSASINTIVPGDALKEASDSAGIGFVNVLTRLRMVSGSDASITVDNIEPVGIRISLKIQSNDRSVRP